MNFNSSKLFFKNKDPIEKAKISKEPMYMRNASIVLGKNMQ